MKKLFLTLFLSGASLISVISTGCQKDQEFSCDPKANEYAKINATANQSISRDSLVKLPINIQFAVFNSLTNINKQRIFREKLDILKTEISFSAPELLAIDQIYNSSPNVYNQQDPFHAWELHVRNNLGWTEANIFEYVGTWFTSAEIHGPIYIAKMSDDMSESGGSGASRDCHCLYDAGCGLLVGDCDKNIDCNKKRGCGILGTAYCEGRCSNLPLP